MRGFKKFKEEVESFTFGPLGETRCWLEKGHIFVQLSIFTADKNTGNPFRVDYTRMIRDPWPLVEVREVLEGMWTAAWEHEKREFMRRRGRKVYRPH